MPCACGNSQVVYSHSPIAVEKLRNIVPLGNLNPPGHAFPTDHTYWDIFVTEEVDGEGIAEEVVDVVAPADIWIPLITSMEYEDDDNYFDYTVVFSPCRGVFGNFIHLDQVTEEIEEGYKKGLGFCVPTSPGGRNIKLCLKLTGLTLKAGDKIGTIGSHANSTGIDFGMTDKRAILPYISKQNQRHNWVHTYSVCPLEYFPEDIKGQLYSLVGDSRKKREVAPLCGMVHQDVKGTAQGNWYFNGTDQGDTKEENGVALVHDNIDPTVPVFSTGFKLAEIGIEPKVYFVDDVKSDGFVNRDFSEVVADENVYCYELYGGDDTYMSFLVALENENLLKIGNNGDRPCGTGPWEFGQYVNFKR
jgi:hypothetical protein